MGFKIKVINHNKNTFSINNNKPLSKTSYIIFNEGDKVGIKNKFTKKIMVDATHFSNYHTKQVEEFKSLSDLMVYLNTYIVNLNEEPSIFNKDIQIEILENLKKLNENFTKYFEQNPN